jgi:glycosyltransferase involved in cell wall biosynthesis
LRTLHIVPSFYPAWAYGGTPRCAYELCRALIGRGVEVHVWTTDAYDRGGRLAERASVIDGVRVQRFRNLSNSLAYHRQLYLPLGLCGYTRRHIGRFDLIHVHSHRHFLQLCVRAAQAAQIPYVFTGHGTVPGFERYVSIKRVVDLLGARAFLRRAAACVAVSDAERQPYLDAGVSAERIHVIADGIRLEDYATLPDRGAFRRRYGLGDGPLVLFLGKITPRKGLDVLLRAIARLPSEVRLAVVGNFMMPAHPSHRLAEELRIAERVRFVGVLTGAEKLTAYVDADVLAYPSTGEIFGLVPFEALMCGTPAVVCDDSGCGERLTAAGGGLVVPYRDSAALAAAVDHLLRTPALRARCVASGRAYVRRYLGWDQIAEQTRDLYQTVLGGAAGSCAVTTASQ